MSFLDRFFKNRRATRLPGGYVEYPKGWNRSLYEQDTARSAIDCIATHAAKATVTHVVMDKNGRVREVKHDSPYARLLNGEANPLQSGYDLKYTLVTLLQRDTTAFCYVKHKAGVPQMAIPLPKADITAYEMRGGGIALEFFDDEGEQVLLNAEDVVAIRKYSANNSIFGGGNAPLYGALDMMQEANKGLAEALQTSNKIRGIVKQKKAMLDRDDVDSSTEAFMQRYMNAAKNGGIIGLDSMEEYTPLNMSTWSAPTAQMKDLRENILRYFRVSDAIVRSDYNAEQWQAFYEGVIEPILVQMGQAFTNVCFTPEERKAGNRLIFAADIMLNMSMSQKTALLTATREIGVFTRNEYRAMFGYAPMEGGDEIEVSLNYVTGDKQNEYQGVGKEE